MAMAIDPKTNICELYTFHTSKGFNSQHQWKTNLSFVVFGRLLRIR
jgi:hypothetical protein